MLKFFRKVFGRKKHRNAECQAVVIDYDKISYSAREMRKNNSDVHCVYQSVQENITDVGEQLRRSEDLMNEVAKSFTEMEKMAERACEILCAEKEKLDKKKETLWKLKEDVEDSKYRLTCLKGSALEEHVKAAESGTAVSLGSSVRKEREQLEHRLSVAKTDVDKYTEQNMEDEVVIQNVQLIRERLQQDHDSHVRHLQNECVNMEKKNTLLKFREKHFNSNEGKTELLTFFRVPKEEQEATKKRFASLKKRKEALLEKVQGQRKRRVTLAEYNAHLEKSIKKKKHEAMLG
ncbi:intermediate filament protein ifa-1-like [Ostrea edulis]|uniref:intermediate filament protein ifa-1-like n=1 Tax=Ostrea edulis TaxID=37623 RepID=UPI0024AE8868|nr:intermediate filament protein ifa-1-like [Ostrea edulis]